MKLVGMKIILFWYELHTVVFAVYWDRRLLLAARFTLKSFEKYKLYLREDLPPQARQSSNRKSSNSSQHDFHEKVALSDPVNVPTDRDSTCDVMDGSTK